MKAKGTFKLTSFVLFPNVNGTSNNAPGDCAVQKVWSTVSNMIFKRSDLCSELIAPHCISDSNYAGAHFYANFSAFLIQDNSLHPAEFSVFYAELCA